MKKIILTAAIIFSCLSAKIASAQISLSINIGSQPEWGPTGYDHADYYYMPDIDTYYDVNSHEYVYLNNNAWVRTTVLPARYSSYDVYHGYKVVVNERTPWVHDNVYRTKYVSYKGRRDQTIIRDTKEVKYRNHYVEHRPAARKVVVHKQVVRHEDRNDHHDDRGHGERDHH